MLRSGDCALYDDFGIHCWKADLNVTLVLGRYNQTPKFLLEVACVPVAQNSVYGEAE